MNILKLPKNLKGILFGAGVITGIVGACIFHKENRKPTKTKDNPIGKIIVNPIDGQLTIMLSKDPAEIKPGSYTIMVVQQEEIIETEDRTVS